MLLGVVAVAARGRRDGRRHRRAGDGRWSRTLLRRNVLERILERPGARALPGLAGRGDQPLPQRRRGGRHASSPGRSTRSASCSRSLVGLAILVRVDPWMTLFVLALLGVVVALVEPVATARRGVPQANQQAIGDVTGLLGELFGAALAVKVAGAERRVVAHLASINERRRRAGVRDQVFNHVVQGISQSTGEPRHRPAAAGRRRGDARRQLQRRRLRAVRLVPRLAGADDELGRRCSWPGTGRSASRSSGCRR